MVDRPAVGIFITMRFSPTSHAPIVFGRDAEQRSGLVRTNRPSPPAPPRR